VIDVAGGDKIPRKGGPGITQSDVLVINKTDIADAIGADLGVMAHDAKHMRGDGPIVFAQVKHDVGVEEVAVLFLEARTTALGGSSTTGGHSKDANVPL
jgi:urease accessory protein